MYSTPALHRLRANARCVAWAQRFNHNGGAKLAWALVGTCSRNMRSSLCRTPKFQSRARCRHGDSPGTARRRAGNQRESRQRFSRGLSGFKLTPSRKSTFSPARGSRQRSLGDREGGWGPAGPWRRAVMEDRTHSSHTGLTDETARTRRACKFVRQLAADLNMPTTTTCSALAIWHAYVAERDRPGGSGLDSEGKQIGA